MVSIGSAKSDLDDGTKIDRVGGVFDSGWYLGRYPDVADAGLDALAHFEAYGEAEGRQPNEFFDPAWYLDNNPDVVGGWLPLRHYLEYGWREGRWPGPEFDPSSYLEANPDVAEAGMEPLAHYISFGRAEGRQLRQIDPSSSGQHSPLLSDVGACEALQSVFDSGWYLEQYPDVADAGLDALTHFEAYGEAEGRQPNEFFDPAWYLDNNPDVVGGWLPLRHYLEYGWREGRWPGPEFDPSSYLEANPDVAEAGMEPLAHYISFGRAEGRQLRQIDPDGIAQLSPPLPRSPTEWSKQASKIPSVLHLRAEADKQSALLRSRDSVISDYLDRPISYLCRV